GFTGVLGQPPDPNSIPAGNGNKDLSENNIKTRSIALERIKREADRNAIIRREDGIALNFGMIKKDFEGIQKRQTRIVDAYTKSKKINYTAIRKSAGKITEMGIRLNSNLFPVNEKEKDGKSIKKPVAAEVTKPRTIRNLIIALDNAIGKFVSSEMFKNLRVVDPVVSKTTQTELDKIIKLSNVLWLEAKRKSSE
ncbi:MAG: hypothetical protein HKN25_18235, partial [Pyrinomonadaceae bacterium]|nr:hypothetical protein [Pyrinomonadaceae bacterium]